MNMWERVYEIVKRVPRGKVVTYGQIALELGNPRLSQRVGQALHVNKDWAIVPCHRVVNRFGELSKSFKFGGVDAQKFLLEAEGVEISDDYIVDLKRYRFFF